MAQELKVHQREPRVPDAGGAQARRPQRIAALAPFDEIERLFDELLPSRFFRLGGGPVARSLVEAARTPRIDLIERDNEVLVRAEVPGVNKNDLDISLDESSVTMRGTVAHEAEDSSGEVYRAEIVRGEFARTVALPAAIDTEKTKASLRDGVLELVMPKLEAAKRRKIKVQ